MEIALDRNAPSASSSALLPVMGAIFVALLVVGLAMPVLPLQVHDGLGLSTVVVGLVAGSQFTASIVSRAWAGRHADARGAKRTVVVGLLLASAGGVPYLLSLRFTGQPVVSAALLFVGRALLGAGESFAITGAQAWGLVLAGERNAGKVIAWVGTALYAAFALGAPLGTILYSHYGFAAIGFATVLIPLASLALVAPLPQVAQKKAAQASIRSVLRAVWLPGLGLALTSAGFGAMTAFASLLFSRSGWLVWTAFTAFAGALILARTFLGSAADRMGGARVALIFLLVESAGLAVLWLASSFVTAIAGAALTGFGLSLVPPGFGVEVVRRAPAGSHGLAIGIYGGFLDVALAVGSPTLGFVASVSNIGTVFLVAALLTACAAPIALRLTKRRAVNTCSVSRPNTSLEQITDGGTTNGTRYRSEPPQCNTATDTGSEALRRHCPQVRRAHRQRALRRRVGAARPLAARPEPGHDQRADRDEPPRPAPRSPRSGARTG
jgi:MFS family permease